MSVKFGPGGNSEDFYASGFKSTLEAPDYVSKLGLQAYEYEGGNGISARPDTLIKIGNRAKELGISMSLHSPYFISLSSVEKEKREKSVEYIRQSAVTAEYLGANVTVVHSGSAAKLLREDALTFAEETLYNAAQMLNDGGYGTHIGLETMGKKNQLGTLDEVIRLCKVDKSFCPVVDFGHLNALYNGCFFTKDDYKKVFEAISLGLGAEYAEHLHCHFSKIEYTAMGEKKHLTFDDNTYGPEFLPLAQAIVELGVSPTIICESAGTMSRDALTMKRIYEEIKDNDK